ncbi:MAG: hypothetical protein J7J61_09615 [Candidatus Hydrothermae bacterium]|nr:hypothetical protein [Candidatus Hydrothermae bacterium]
MSKINALLEQITEQLYTISQFLESLDGEEINASAKASLINIRNLAIAILNETNKLIAKKDGLR